MAVEFHRLLARGVFATYGFFVIDSDTGRGLLVDPGAQPELFLETACDNGWRIDAILLTHGHFDHFGAVETLVRTLDAPVMAHELSARYLLNPQLNLSAVYGDGIVLPCGATFVDGERIYIGSSGASLEVLHAPGHTDDSCAFWCAEAGIALVGDTVYEGGPGLTVFPTGDASRLHENILRKLLTLPPETVFLSGHSDPITAGQLSTRI